MPEAMLEVVDAGLELECVLWVGLEVRERRARATRARVTAAE
jgi:hypothetical protein